MTKSKKRQRIEHSTTKDEVAGDDPPTTENSQLRRSSQTGRKSKGSKIITKSLQQDVSSSDGTKAAIGSILPTPFSNARRSTGSDSEKKKIVIPNIILHLKCSLNDLESYNHDYQKQLTDPLLYNPEAPPEVKSYEDEHENQNYSIYNTITTSEKIHESDKILPCSAYPQLCSNCGNLQGSGIRDPKSFQSSIIAESDSITDVEGENVQDRHFADPDIDTLPSRSGEFTHGNDRRSLAYARSREDEETNRELKYMKELHQKLKTLKIQLFKNNLFDKKSACFWCTYEFDNPEVFIPKYEMDNKMYGYGSFCRPECAAAYLFKEPIDDSVKFERYHFLNQIYGKAYQYKKSIRPAPNPYYLLDKFYGNLSIQEYRRLLKSDYLLQIVENPMTRILPELHEETGSDMFPFPIGLCTKNTDRPPIRSPERGTSDSDGNGAGGEAAGAIGIIHEDPPQEVRTVVEKRRRNSVVPLAKSPERAKASDGNESITGSSDFINHGLRMDTHVENRVVRRSSLTDGVYKIKRQSEQKKEPKKTNLIRNHFGL